MKKHTCCNCGATWEEGELEWVKDVIYAEWFTQCPFKLGGCGGTSFYHSKSYGKVFCPSKSILQQLYIDNLMSMREIGNEYKVSHATVGSWLKHYKIKIRSMSEASVAWITRKQSEKKRMKEQGKRWAA